jgi:hypothetical protein
VIKKHKRYFKYLSRAGTCRFGQAAGTSKVFLRENQGIAGTCCKTKPFTYIFGMVAAINYLKRPLLGL